MRFRIKLNGLDVTEYVALPINIQTTLDESLDQASIRLVNTDMQQPIKPLSELDIDFLEDYSNIIKKTYSFFVSVDTVAENIASGTYNHELSLIELTKWLERFTNIVKCNTKPLIHDFSELQNNVYYIQKQVATGKQYEYKSQSYISPVLPNNYKILSGKEFANKEGITLAIGLGLPKTITAIYENNKLIFETNDIEKSKNIQFQNGKTYKIFYRFNEPTTGEITVKVEYTMYIDCITTEKTTPKSVPKVIELLLANAETIAMNQAPRFALDPAFIEKYKNVEAPEINMQGTLFECLSQIGDFIHCIPRLRKRTNEDKNISNPTKYIVTFDEITKNKYVGEDLEDYLGHTESFIIDRYATSLDSNIDNIVNTDNIGEGSLVEPNSKGWKTPRAEMSQVVVEDTECFIETREPIEYIVKLECGYIGNKYIGDITPFVYSKTEYDGQLSAITDNYPLSQGFAVYYQPGSKNIYGLSKKLPNAISSVFANFAIFNIIKQKTGVDYSESIDIRDLQFRVTYVPISNARVRQTKTEIQEGLPSSINFNQNAPKISSNLFGEAIKGALSKLGNPEITKSYLFTDIEKVPTIYEKFDDDHYISVVKTECYNDLIKCDLGLTKNYNRKDKYMAINSQIRYYEVSELQATDRQLYYEDYCIVGKDVSVANYQEVYYNENPKMTTLIKGENKIDLGETRGSLIEIRIQQGEGSIRLKLAIGELLENPIESDLGLDFTAIDFGLNTTLTVDVKTDVETKIGLYKVFANFENPLVNNEGLSLFANSFYPNPTLQKIDVVNVITESNKIVYSDLQFPLTRLGFGNSILYHFEFPDNFTAGTKRSNIENNLGVTRVQNQESYSDNFGEFDYMYFRMGRQIFTNGELTNETKAVEYGNALPTTEYENSDVEAYIATTYENAIRVNKDNREVIGMNYQINFVTNDDTIIGSELAKSSVLISNKEPQYKLYLLPNRIDKLANEIDLTDAIDLGFVEAEIQPNNTEKMQIKLRDVNAGENTAQAWAICNGNKLVMGKNVEIKPSSTILMPFLTFKHII